VVVCAWFVLVWWRCSVWLSLFCVGCWCIGVWFILGWFVWCMRLLFGGCLLLLVGLQVLSSWFDVRAGVV
jgi:hypothetical protein